jgi:predicted ATP-dependent endonuclease of OLD family
MSIRLTIKNYRCFVAPAVVEFSPGFTAFVGVNNAGKSALIRFLVEFRQLFEVLQNQTVLSNHLSGQKTHVIHVFHVFDQQEAFSNLNENSIELKLEFEHEDPIDLAATTSILINIQRDLSWEIEAFHNENQFSFAPGAAWHPSNKLGSKNGQLADFSDLSRIAKTLHNTLYIGPFRNIINIGANTTYFDIQIGDAFVAQFRELKTGASKKNSIGIQRLIDDVRKIFEFDSLAIDPSSDNHSLHIAVNGKPFKQHELGSGLSQFIVVLANAAIKRPSLILIDEPELNLHPRLQLDFLTALGSYSDKGVWFSTHSLGLAKLDQLRKEFIVFNV